MTVRNWITKLLKVSNKVEQVFYVSERDKGDYNNLLEHMLIGTNSFTTYKEVKYGLGDVSVAAYQPNIYFYLPKFKILIKPYCKKI